MSSNNFEVKCCIGFWIKIRTPLFQFTFRIEIKLVLYAALGFIFKHFFIHFQFVLGFVQVNS